MITKDEKLADALIASTVENIRVIIDIPKNVYTDKEIRAWFWKEFNIDIDLSGSDATDGNLYFNQDERSLCGILHDLGTQHIDFTLFPTYYAKFFSSEYVKLYEAAKIIVNEDDYDGKM